MLSQEIRKKFLAYFKEKGHAVVPSSPTIPHDDPTLLFINAGMNQFKDVFLGKSERDYTRATSSQKCIRVGGKHNDLDNVGHTSRHMTFFEMLGNFSFGDYFKKEAIDFAWYVSTEIFQFDPKRVWVSVFETDDEAYELWKPHIDEKRIIRLGEEENFWSMGDTGPCGPCSEILYDRGEKFGTGSSPFEDPTGERYPEFWNLVFMQYNRDQNGKINPLPKQSVDTGAGLERVVSFMKEQDNVFQSDILSALITRVEELSGKKYDANDKHFAPAFHVIADHVRALAFAMADGAQPSNIERGYVLRKILRRAVRYGRLLGFQKPFLAEVFPTLVETMGDDYHELKSAQSQISEVLSIEEEGFFRTLRRGGNILNSIIEKAEKSARKEISGEAAFKLKDTYGFPLEEILLIAKDSELSVNLDAYELLEKQARDRSRQTRTSHKQIAESTIFEEFVKHHGTSEFFGYDKVELEGTIKGLIVEGKTVDTMEGGQEGLVILDKTPFYAEKGGQVGDRGTLIHGSALFNVADCQTPYAGVIAHQGVLKEGILMVGEPVVAKINEEWRGKIAKHHTATHLLHWALQKVLGSHIRQAGSLVEPGRLRFDFNHHKALTKEEIREIEQLVNEKIWENKPLKTYELQLEDVQNHPEIKQFFGEKYGKAVRVVDINGYSKELCGGTHVNNVGEIGYFRIAKEASIAKGVRRIEGVTGKEAEKLRYALEDQLKSIALTLKANIPKVEDSLKALVKENEGLKEKALFERKKHLNELTTTLLRTVKSVNNIPILSAIVDVEKKELNDLGTNILERMKTGVLLLCVIQGEQCQLFLRVSPDLVEQGIHANVLIKEIAAIVEGAGGGKKDTAQAGGKNTKGVIIAFDKIQEMLENP
ncbi:alanine--tRNA ligase [Candidatus Neptunichlamydia sp. REUL1]|uniref:alanine--tRNA ligase n=1 Tax=Candidatus Neptunichlamydia sp. REUL1 TaxID=3064277 RepID=UPI0029316B34|nr:alanine--tRNA ligase [Candidatus Neptunochlamydia sp. REUL1]